MKAGRYSAVAFRRFRVTAPGLEIAVLHDQQQTGQAESAPTAGSRCPRSGSEGKPVKPVTVRAMLKPGLRDQVQNETYRFCGDADCEVVYFTMDGRQVFTKDDVAARVGIKESEPPRPLCYCFGHSVESIREELASTGQITALDSIRSQMKVDGCRCEVTNPRGTCCLEDVAEVVKQLQDKVPPTSAAESPPATHCCDNASPQPKRPAPSRNCCGVQPVKFQADGRDKLPAMPDWTVMTSSAAREAVEGVLEAGWRGKDFADLDASAIRLLAVILQLYADLGRPPSEQSLAATTGMAQEEVCRLLGDLHQHDLVILNKEDRTIRGAYPFTETITGHTVNFTRTERVLNTMCFVDALGAAAMCRQNAVVHSACHTCGVSIAVNLCGEGMMLGELRPFGAVVWVGFKASCGCAADSLCREMVPFCCDDHLERWRASGHTGDGRRLSVEEAFQVGKSLFADRAMQSQK